MAENRKGGGMGPWAFIFGAIVILVVGVVWYMGAVSPAIDAPAVPAVDTTDSAKPDTAAPVEPAPAAQPPSEGGGTVVPAPAPAD